MNKSAIENANWTIAHAWHEGLGLTYAGVDLGDALTYEVLNVLGRIWKLNNGQPVAGETTTDDQTNDTP